MVRSCLTLILFFSQPALQTDAFKAPGAVTLGNVAIAGDATLNNPVTIKGLLTCKNDFRGAPPRQPQPPSVVALLLLSHVLAGWVARSGGLAVLGHHLTLPAPGLRPAYSRH